MESTGNSNAGSRPSFQKRNENGELEQKKREKNKKKQKVHIDLIESNDFT